jgi:serine phosphatase RsbU (regulator of sigma subunit)
VAYDEVTMPLDRGDVYVFCTDGIYETMDEQGAEFGAGRVCEIVGANRYEPARAIVDAIFDAVAAFRGAAPQQDDMTAVAVRITT